MEVLEDEHERSFGGQPAKGADHRIEQPGEALGRVLEVGAPGVGEGGRRSTGTCGESADEVARPPEDLRDDRGSELSRQRSEGFGERGVRQPTVRDVETPTEGCQGAAGLGAAEELGHEPRLADPRFPGDQHHRRSAIGRLGQGFVEPSELGVPTHEDLAARPATHAADHAGRAFVRQCWIIDQAWPGISRSRVATRGRGLVSATGDGATSR